MPRIELDIANGFYRSDSLPVSAQRCQNWFPVIAEAPALSAKALFPTPGLVQLSVNGVDAGRGAITVNDIAYFINGTSLYSVSSAGVSSALGTISGTGRVSTATNGQYLVIVVPGGNAYSYDTTAGVLTQITDVDFITSDTVTYKDGYFVFTASAGNVFFNSELNDPLTYDALKFGTAEISPDKIVSTHVNHNELFVVGVETIEVFQNIGGVGFPFQRIQGANIQKGSHATFSTVEFDNTFIFIGGGLNELSAVWRVTGSSSVAKVSTNAIDTEIQKFTRAEISDAFAWTYSCDGAFFAGFTFESLRIPSKTFVYDATASALSGRSIWHERQSGLDENRWRVNHIISAYGKLLVTDSTTGKIGTIEKATYTEYGETIFREITTQPYYIQDVSFIVGELQLFTEAGVGLTTGQGSDPQIMYDYSDDGALTWSNQTTRPFGKIGEYQAVTTWRRQGLSKRNRVLRFKVSDPVKAVLIKLYAIAEQGVQ